MGAVQKGLQQAGRMAAVILLAASVGCGGGFFNPGNGGAGNSGGSSSDGGSATGNAVYVANSNLNLETVSSYSLSTTGSLSSLSGSPSALGSVPATMAENPAGTLLFVGTTTGAIYVYTIGSGGALTLGGSGGPVGAILASSMVIDPSGQWLLAMSDTGSAPIVYVYSINASTGALTSAGNPLALDNGSALQLSFAPSGTQVFAALGTGGVDVMSFAASTGNLQKLSVLLSPLNSNDADQSVAVSPNGKYLYVAETGVSGVRALNISSNGSLSSISGSPFSTGLGPISVLVDSTGSYVYVANSTAGTISAFAIGTNGGLTTLSGSPFSTGAEPVSLAEDNTHSFLLVACAGGSPDLQVFSIGGASASTPGALTSVNKVSTGSVSPAGAADVVTTP